MNPDTQLLLTEFQKLAAAQTATQKKLDDQSALLERRFFEADQALEQRFQEADSAVEQRIIDSELRQDVRLTSIEKVAGDLQTWRQEHEGVVDDLRLRLGKLDKYWNRSVLESASPFTEPGIFTEPPLPPEQYAAFSPASYMAARPNGHHDDNIHREKDHGALYKESLGELKRQVEGS